MWANMYNVIFFSGQPITIKCGTKISLSIDISFVKSVDGASLDSLRSSSCNPCCCTVQWIVMDNFKIRTHLAADNVDVGTFKYL